MIVQEKGCMMEKEKVMLEHDKGSKPAKHLESNQNRTFSCKISLSQ